MNESKPKNEVKRVRTEQFFALFCTSALLILLTSCACNEKRHQAVTDILEQQNELLSKVENLRKTPPVVNRVEGDQDLKRAESYLNASLEAISESNKKAIQVLKAPSLESL